jgi:regulator of sigma E protease
MHLFLTVVVFLVIFSALILIHELGHFMAAKRAGVKVEEFGFGLPPRMFGVKRGETLYSFNWIPFGGFVRMLGEDDSSKEAMSSKRSYSNQPFRVQAWIVCAGVIMNLLLAFVLLTIGFVVGIEPLIATQDDFLKAVRDETVQVESGIVVTESKGGALDAGDRVLGFETLESWQNVVTQLQDDPSASKLLTVENVDDIERNVALTAEDLEQATFYPLYLPRLVYRDQEDSVFHGSLQSGDILLSVSAPEVSAQSGQILTTEDLEEALSSLQSQSDDPFIFLVDRPGQGEVSVSVLLPSRHPVISYVEAGSPADQLGLQSGDQILNVNSFNVYTAEQVVTATGTGGENVAYEIWKTGSVVAEDLSIPRREDGRIGVALADPVPYFGNLSLYPSYVPHTLMHTQKVSYGWEAPVVAVQEMWRLGKMTAVMFVNVLKQFVTAGGVPEGVSGPVGIAQMTGITLTQGWAAMLRFVAMLSLSLGVINILPLPALDGGHFALILLKAVSGKKRSFRWEHVINMGGFLFLMAFILYITFNDVLSLF